MDKQKGISRSHPKDDEESAKIVASSVPLSNLIIPSVKEVNPCIYLSNFIHDQLYLLLLNYGGVHFVGYH